MDHLFQDLFLLLELDLCLFAFDEHSMRVVQGVVFEFQLSLELVYDVIFLLQLHLQSFNAFFALFQLHFQELYVLLLLVRGLDVVGLDHILETLDLFFLVLQPTLQRLYFIMQVDRIRKIVTISHKALILFEPTLKNNDLVPQLRNRLSFLLELALFFDCFVGCFSEGLHLLVLALQLVLQFAGACSKGLEFLGDVVQLFLGVFDGDGKLVFVLLQGLIIFLQDLIFLPLFLLLSVPLCLLVLIYFFSPFDLFFPISVAINLLLQLLCHCQQLLDFLVLLRDDVMVELLLYLHIFEFFLLLVKKLSFLEDFHAQISYFLVLLLAFLEQTLVTLLQLADLLCLRVCFLQFCVEACTHLLKISFILGLILQYLILELRYLQLQLLYFPIFHTYLFPVVILHLPVPAVSIIKLLSQSTQLYLQRSLLFLDLLQVLLQPLTVYALLAGCHSLI